MTLAHRKDVPPIDISSGRVSAYARILIVLTAFLWLALVAILFEDPLGLIGVILSHPRRLRDGSDRGDRRRGPLRATAQASFVNANVRQTE